MKQQMVLVVDGHQVGGVEEAVTARQRTRGLLGRDGIDGAMLFDGTRSIHTIGMRFALDVAYGRWTDTSAPASSRGREGDVLEVAMMVPGRIGRPRRRAQFTIEAEAGRFQRWRLVPGSHIEIRLRDEMGT